MGKDTAGHLAFKIRDWLNNAQHTPTFIQVSGLKHLLLKSIFVAKALPTFAPLYDKASSNI